MDDTENVLGAVSHSCAQQELTAASMAEKEASGSELECTEEMPCSDALAAMNEVGSCLPDDSPHSSDDGWSTFDDGWSSSDDKRERSSRPSLCIDDVRAAGYAAQACGGEKLEPQHMIPRFETIHEMTRKFYHFFTTLHTERECVGNVYICSVCRLAQRTLVKIRLTIHKNPEGRRIVLNNTNFMRLLVKLCSLNSLGQPRICTVGSRELDEYYEMRGPCRKLIGEINVLDDQTSKKVWENFLGDAAKSIETLTYSFKLLRASVAIDRGDTLELEKVDEAETSREAVPAASANFEKGSLDVARCIDARHFVVYRGSKMCDNVRAVAKYSSKVVDREPREDPPDVGDVAGLIVSGGEFVRVLVLKVIEETAVVWEIDNGRMYSVHWANLVDVLPAFRRMPPAVGLAVVRDVQAVPFLDLVRECVELVRSIVDPDKEDTAFYTHMVSKLADLGVINVLSDLILCPDYKTRMAALACLILLCRRYQGREAVANVGLLNRMVSRLDKLASKQQGSLGRIPEEDEKKALLHLLSSIFFNDERIRANSADSDVIAVLLKVRESTGNDTFRQDVDICLRLFLGPPPARDRASSSQEYGYQRSFSEPTHRDRPPDDWDYVQQGSASGARSTQLAPTPDRLESHKNSSKALECDDGAKPLCPADVRSDLTLSCGVTGPPIRGGGGRFYISGRLVRLRSDETHELRPVKDMRQVSARILSKVACSFLNTWKSCTIYYGISVFGFVRGVKLNNEEKDNVRTGVDFIIGNLRPQVMSSSFGVEFVPVLRSAADSPEDAVHFVVEVWVRGVPHTVYTTWDGDCYLRENGSSYQAFSNKVRAWVAKMDEARYRKTDEESKDKDDALEVAAIPATE